MHHHVTCVRGRYGNPKTAPIDGGVPSADRQRMTAVHDATTDPTTELDGVVFSQHATLTLWAVLVGFGTALNLCLYAWLNLDWWIFDGPTPAEQATLGIYLTTWALCYTLAACAFFHGAQRHSRRHLTPWLGLAACAVIHFLLGVPVLGTALRGDVETFTMLPLGLNPFVYIAAVPAFATLARPRTWRTTSGRLVAAVTALTVVFPFVAIAAVTA